MNNYATQDIGYILHRRLYRESSLILEVFTKDHGHITLLAKGARRPKSLWRGITQIFIPLLLGWRGHGGLSTLVMAEIHKSGVMLKGKDIIVGWYLNELLIKLLGKNLVYDDIFVLYQEILQSLAEGRFHLAKLRYFEYDLLQALGYGLCLIKEIDTDKVIVKDKHYCFVPGEGLFSVSNLLKKEQNKESIFLGGSLLALHFKKLEGAQCLQDAKRLLRMGLALCLGNKSIKSRELWLKTEGRNNAK